MTTASLMSFILIMIFVFWLRTRRMRRPIKGKGLRLIVPLIFMIPMLLVPFNSQLHLTTLEVVSTILLGLVMSLPLIFTTNYEVREDGQIYAKQSRAFIYALIALVAIRLGLREYLSGLDPQELAALFLIIAVSYVLPWRIVSYVKFRKIWREREGA
jgi:membrane protein CcdC involved in cytochrome C biogenesis